jgi:hypothetical protein
VAALLPGASDAAALAPARLRHEVVRRAADDLEVRIALCRAWRVAHEEIVAAARMAAEAAADVTAACAMLLESFVAEQVVLEMVTDESDAGWPLFYEYVELLESEPLRRQLLEVAARLHADPPACTTRPRRVVVFGGHPRDESKLRRRLLADGSFDVRWKTCEKSHGDLDDVTLSEALCGADAVVIITSLVSHNLMRSVRRLADSLAIPWRCISKATELQLGRVLEQLCSQPADEAVPGSGQQGDTPGVRGAANLPRADNADNAWAT